jgi:AraC family transcriptional regulator of arabinose operon
MTSASEGPPFPIRDIGIVGIGARVHGPMHSWVWETTLPYFNFWFLMQGVGRLKWQGRDFELKPGTCFLFTPGTRVSAFSTSPESVVNFSVHFFPKPRRDVKDADVEPLAGRKVHRMALFLELAQYSADACKRGDKLGIRQAELAALQMMLHLRREASLPVSRTKDDRILQVLAESANAGGVSVPKMARLAGLSTSQFTRRFRGVTGVAPGSYLIRERISHACALLTETAQSVSEVAETLGYADTSYFVRQFQTVMKVTPARFRRTATE